jgi:hypothetical protein
MTHPLTITNEKGHHHRDSITARRHRRRHSSGHSTWPAWLDAQDRLAGDLHARHITDTDSGRGINVEQPQLVSRAIREVIDQARA